MSVKKFKINRDELTNESMVNIPIDLGFQPVDNSEIIDREFVEDHVDDAINPIIDNEKYRFIPAYEDESGDIHQIKLLYYNLHFLDSGSHTVNITTYDQIGFNQNDLKFRKNYFKNSFLRLDLYDSDISSDQNLLTFSDLFCNLKVPATDGDLVMSDIQSGKNLPKTINNIPVQFELTNPNLLTERIHEGFNLFWYKDELPQDLYMRATFNNAKNGEYTEFMTINGTPDINQFIDELHTKFTLKKNDNFYYYLLDLSYNNNVTVSTLSSGYKKIEVDLYEVNVS